jgi:hypothetical protein
VAEVAVVVVVAAVVAVVAWVVVAVVVAVVAWVAVVVAVLAVVATVAVVESVEVWYTPMSKFPVWGRTNPLRSWFTSEYSLLPEFKPGEPACNLQIKNVKM